MRKSIRKPYRKKQRDAGNTDKALMVPQQEVHTDLSANLGGDHLQRCISQWQLGDWINLSKTEITGLEKLLEHRGEIALLVGSAHYLLGNFQAADDWLGRAEGWGVPRQRCADVMLAGVHGTLARAALAMGDETHAEQFLRSALSVVRFSGDIELLVPIRKREELRRIMGAGFRTENIERTPNTLADTNEPVDFQSIFTIPIALDGVNSRARFNTSIKNAITILDGKISYNASSDARIYAVTSSTGRYENPGVVQFKLESKSEYLLEAFFSHDGAHNPVLWVFEYSAGKKVHAKNIELENGFATIRLTPHDETDELAVGIRLEGSGYIDCERSWLRLNKSAFSVEKVGKAWVKEVCEQEYKSQSFDRFNERAVEFSFIFEKLRTHYPKKILDVGSGMTALPQIMRNTGALVTAIDNVTDYWSEAMVNRHYHVINDDITQSRLSGNYDFISCVSVLEHIENFTDAVAGMARLLRSDGLLAISFPYNEDTYVRNVYLLPGSSYGKGAPYITQVYSRKEIEGWLGDNNLELLDQEYWEFWSGEFWTVGEQIIPPRRADKYSKHQLTCLLLRKKK